MPEIPSVATARGRLAVSTRWHPKENHSDLRRELAAAKLADYVARVVAEAPPLTEDQKHRIASLLGGVTA